MMEGVVPWLFGFTLIIALAYAFWQWRATRRAQKHHEQSAMPAPDTAAQRASGREPAHPPGSASGHATAAASTAGGRADHSDKTRI